MIVRSGRRTAVRSVVLGLAFAVAWAAVGRPTAAQEEGSGALGVRTARLQVTDVDLADALRSLQQRSGVRIGFSPEALPDAARVSCDCADVTVSAALRRLLAETGLTFVERRSQILIVPAGEPELGAAGLRGRVVERESGDPIRSARVVLNELGQATLTDADGRFDFPALDPGAYHLEVEALGYLPSGRRRVEVEAGGHATASISLAANPLVLAEIVVAPGTFGMLEEVTFRPQTLTRAQMRALPQLGEDVFRTLERLPGVATDDISARMSVRGGNEDELLVMLDGAELFEPYHLKDLDAALGVIDVATLRGASLVAGGLPTEHGDRMAGLLDMRTRQPVGEGARHSVGFSVSNVTARTQGSFGDGAGGWYVSARRGFLDLLLDLAEASSGSSNDELSPSYFDVMGKVELFPADGHRLSVHTLYAGDDLSLAELDPSGDSAELGSQWTNVNLWATWDWRANAALDVTTVVSTSRLERSRRGDWDAPGSSEVADYAVVDDRASFDAHTIRQDWSLGVRPGLVLKAGGQLRLTHADYRYDNVVGREFVDASGSVALALDTTSAALAPRSTESTVYLAARVQPFAPLTVEAGARYDRRSHTGDSDVSPRLHVAWEVGGGTTVRGSIGEYRQSHGVEELSVVDGDTLFFPSEVARQVAVGIEHRFANDLRLRLEGYSRRTDEPRPRWVNVGREIIPFPEIGEDRVRIDPDRARAQGLELDVSGPLGSRAQGSVTYVLARAEDRVGGVWTPRTLDQRHTLGARWHFEPNPRWTLSAGWQYHTGWPSTPMEFRVDTISSSDPTDPSQRQILITEMPGDINSDRLPAYHRLDVRVTRTFSVGRGRLDLFLDVFNLYNRSNLRSYDYGVRLPAGIAIRNPGETLLPLLPSFGLTWTF